MNDLEILKILFYLVVTNRFHKFDPLFHIFSKRIYNTESN